MEHQPLCTSAALRKHRGLVADCAIWTGANGKGIYKKWPAQEQRLQGQRLQGQRLQGQRPMAKATTRGKSNGSWKEQRHARVATARTTTHDKGNGMQGQRPEQEQQRAREATCSKRVKSQSFLPNKAFCQIRRNGKIGISLHENTVSSDKSCFVARRRSSCRSIFAISKRRGRSLCDIIQSGNNSDLVVFRMTGNT